MNVHLSARWLRSFVFVTAVALMLGLILIGRVVASPASSGTIVSPSVVVEAGWVDGRQVKIKVKGQRFGKRAKVTLKGVKGEASGIKRTVKVKKVKTVKRLTAGKYRVIAWRIKNNGLTSKATKIKPRRVRVTNRRGGMTKITYRQALTLSPNMHPETISVGKDHSCALGANGKAWCWGSDTDGQVGDGRRSQTDKYAPVTVVGGRKYSSITVGHNHSCALDTGGKAWCWGSDEFGQVGDGRRSQTDKYAPVAVVGGRKYSSITAGEGHTCAIGTNGKARCWGEDEFGQVGNGRSNQRDKYAPVAVVGGRKYSSITAGIHHSCAIHTNGKAWCWGSDGNGQVGNGSGDDQGAKHSPVKVDGGRSYASIAVGGDHSCAIDASGKAWCWGYDHYGQIGDGDSDVRDKFSPVAVTGGRKYSSMTAGIDYSCALDTARKAWCWGYDHHGQLGDGSSHLSDKYSPVAVDGGRAYASITGGGDHTCAVSAAGKAWCWGSDNFGQVGDGKRDQAPKYSPVAVAGKKGDYMIG